MQIKLFSIPIGADDWQVEELNHFLRANKIIDIKKELVDHNDHACWTFCITYMPMSRANAFDNAATGASKKVDYKEVLEPDAFDRFAALRQLRKQIAERDAVPAYAVFTDAELAEMAKQQELTMEWMRKIPGIGKKKVEKYGEEFVSHESEQADEKSGLLDGADSKS